MNLNQKLILNQKSTNRPGALSISVKKFLRPLIHLVGWLPLLQLAYLWLTDGLTVNPIQFVEQFFGRAALNLLVVALAVTPVVTVTGLRQLSRHRRALGLYAFLYFSLHLLTFVALDYGFDFQEIFRLVLEKPFIIAGVLAGFILTALSITSFKIWMKKMGKNWQRLHKLVYLAGGLVIVHYALAVKGSLATLSGNILKPVLMALLVTLLLILRIPAVRRSVAAWRQRNLG